MAATGLDDRGRLLGEQRPDHHHDDGVAGHVEHRVDDDDNDDTRTRESDRCRPRDRLPVEIYGPREPGDFPVVVMLHGGGWFGGSPASMEPLASSLASAGIVVFNSTYRTSVGGYPESFDDVACDIRFALSKAPDYTTSTRPLTVVAHSAGAHIGSVVSLAGNLFGQDCDVGAEVVVDRFVGLAGPYDPTLYSAVLTGYFARGWRRILAHGRQGVPTPISMTTRS